MKRLFSVLISACALAAFGEHVALVKGVNSVAARGKVAAVECVTVGAASEVAIDAVRVVVDMTNAYEIVVAPRVRYSFVLTNWNGSASVASNVWDRFDPSAFRVLNTNHLVSVRESWIPVTNSVFVGKLPGQSFAVTNRVWSGTTADHYKFEAPTNAWFVGGEIVVDCGENDAVSIIVE